MLLKRNCSLPCSYLITWVDIVFRPRDEPVKEKYAMEEKKDRSNNFSRNIYRDFRYEKKMFLCVYITEWNKD